MSNKKVITGLKIGVFIATKEQKQEIEKAVEKYMTENELPKLDK